MAANVVLLREAVDQGLSASVEGRGYLDAREHDGVSGGGRPRCHYLEDFVVVTPSEGSAEGPHLQLEQLLGDIQRNKLTLEKAKSDPPFEAYPLYRRNCGNMLGEFMARGLITDKAQWASEDAKLLGRILQRYRWASLMRLHTEALKQLPPLEREIFVRWRVQARDAYPIEKRREYLSSLETYAPNFPKGLAMALLEYDAGRKEKAAEILSRYHNQNPADPTYKALYEQITEELAKSPKK